MDVGLTLHRQPLYLGSDSDDDDDTIPHDSPADDMNGLSSVMNDHDVQDDVVEEANDVIVWYPPDVDYDYEDSDSSESEGSLEEWTEGGDNQWSTDQGDGFSGFSMGEQEAESFFAAFRTSASEKDWASFEKEAFGARSGGYNKHANNKIPTTSAWRKGKQIEKNRK